MRVILLILLLALLAAVPARAEVAASILPLQAWASELLGGEEVLVLVGPGQSPALFEPSGRQLTLLSSAEILFAIGVPFEAALLPRIGRMFPDLEVVKLGSGLERLNWPGDGDHGDIHGGDPHIWLDPLHAATVIGEMADALSQARPADALVIGSRAMSMQEAFAELDARLSTRLEPLRGQEILAYHPALGYFAAAYGLRQSAVESGGTEPGARHLTELAARIHEQSLRVLVVEPQFAPSRARALAGSLGLEVVVFDPLATDLISELDRFSTTLVEAAATEGRP